MSLTAASKIKKGEGKKISELETNICQALYDIQENPSNKGETFGKVLSTLHIRAAKALALKGNKEAILLVVPYVQHAKWREIQKRVVRELEKKIGKSVLLIAQRRILRKPGRNNKRKLQKRPMSRTVSSVHDAILEDLVYPSDIIGKRIRHKLNGRKILKVYLDKKDKATVGGKLDVYASVYRQLTGKDTVFMFPVIRQ